MGVSTWASSRRERRKRSRKERDKINMFSSPISRQRREGGPPAEGIREVTSHTTSTTTTPIERDSASPLGSFLFTQAFPLSLLRRSHLIPHNQSAPFTSLQPKSRGCSPINGREKEEEDGYVTTSSRHVSGVSPKEATNDSSLCRRIKGEKRPSSSLSSSSGCDRNACTSAASPVGSSQSRFRRGKASGEYHEESPQSPLLGEDKERLTVDILQQKTRDSGEGRGDLKQVKQHRADDLLLSRNTVTREKRHEGEVDSGHVGPSPSSSISQGVGKDGDLSFSIASVQTPPAPTCIAIRGNFVAVGSLEGVIVLLR